jgi:hypothetical protein
MSALCTGHASVRQEAEHIIATIPSGRGAIEIALSSHEARMLDALIGRTVSEALTEQNRVASAEMLPFSASGGGEPSRC